MRLKSNLRPHTGKLLVGGAVFGYPLYRHRLEDAFARSKEYLAKGTQQVLSKNEPLPKVLES